MTPGTTVNLVMAATVGVLYGTGFTLLLSRSLMRVLIGVVVLGHLETQTSVFLDVGVYLLIIGVVLDLLRALGAGIERDMRDAGERR